MDLKTRAIILRRVNYGEADRIVELITPSGKVSAIAKGARREKSRMAGGIELFSLSDLVVRRKREDGLGILSSVRLVEFFGTGIISDWARLEIAGETLREISKRADGVGDSSFFDITEQTLRALNTGSNTDLIRAWFRLNVLQASGEHLNLWRDRQGTKLQQGENYSWDAGSSALYLDPHGDIGTNEIKLMRLIVTSKLSLVAKVPEAAAIWPLVDRVTQIG